MFYLLWSYYILPIPHSLGGVAVPRLHLRKLLYEVIQETQELWKVTELQHSKVGSHPMAWFCKDTGHQYMLDTRRSFIRTTVASSFMNVSLTRGCPNPWERGGEYRGQRNNYLSSWSPASARALREKNIVDHSEKCTLIWLQTPQQHLSGFCS